MMLSEFTARTGFTPTEKEYDKIEEAYYSFDGDKDAFCRAFVQRGGEKKIYEARAIRIKELESQLLELEKQFKVDSDKQQRRITELETQLDKELEWKPSKGSGTNMDQASYERLRNAGREMTEAEAKELIAEEFGFAPDKIEILRTASSYEVNKYSQLRKAAEYERPPVYEATDWNYIRFNVRGCCTMMWEVENGELRSYCC